MSSTARHGQLWIALAVATGVATSIGRVASAALLSYAPLLLVVLSPIPSHMLLIVPLTTLVPFLAVVSGRRMFTTVIAYSLGREYGSDGIAWATRRYRRFAPLIDAFAQLFSRMGPLVLFLMPGPVCCALAGATGMAWWLTYPIALAGILGWAAVTFMLGDALREYITPLLGLISENLIPITVVLTISVGAYQLHRFRARRSRALSALAAARGSEGHADNG